MFRTREFTGSLEIHQGPHVAKTRQGPTQDGLLGCSGLVIWKSPLQGQAWNAHLIHSIEGGSKGTYSRRHRLSVTQMQLPLTVNKCLFNVLCPFLC